MAKYTFEFEDGTQVVIEAQTLTEAMELKTMEYGNRSWTIVTTKENIRG